MNAAVSVGSRLGGTFDNSSFSIGDTLVQPLWLDWTAFDKHVDISFAYGFYAATGKYGTEVRNVLGNPVRVESPDNIGYGFWTHQVQTAAAWYPFDNPGTAVTGAFTYEHHSDKKDFDLQPGDDMTINYGISQYVPLTSSQQLLLEVGVAGYNGWQVSVDRGTDAANRNRDRTNAAGGQLGITYVPWFLAVNTHAFYEYETRDRTQGTSVVLSVAKKFF